MEDTRPLLPFAHPADVVRSVQKDAQVRGQLRQHILEALEEVVGHRQAQAWLGSASLAADCAYDVATAVLSARTLGEEYCELAVVTADLQRPTPTRRWVASSLASLPTLLSFRTLVAPANRGSRGVGARVRHLLVAVLQLAAATAPMVLRLHLAAFYISGSFRRLADRCTGLRNLSVAERPYRNFSYRPLVFILLLQVFGEVLSRAVQWRRTKTSVAQEAAAAAAVTAAFKGGVGISSGVASSKRAPLCHVCMCPADDVTSTPCGHLFCWECIASWCALKASCPLCRSAVPPQQLLPLHHYETAPGE